MELHTDGARHQRLVRVTHWINALGFAALTVSGVAILIAHPRFYWGETGYFDTPAAFQLPLPVNLDQTGWGRSLHFLAAWVAVLNGAIYAAWGLISGHFRRNFIPTGAERERRSTALLVKRHRRLSIPSGPSGYNLLQRLSYASVVFGLFPLLILTGLTLSPAVTAAFPWLFVLFGGRQSARTVHFLAADALVLFVIVHVAMTAMSGFANNLRSMTTGGYTAPVLDHD